MAGKTFAQINGSLLSSKKLKQCSHQEKWAYICAHLTPLGNFMGQFNYPLVMWAQDAGLTVEEVAGAAGKLSERGLIEYITEEETIRLVGFHRQRPPNNASQMKSLIDDFAGQILEGGRDIETMTLKGASEFIVASVQRSQSWKVDSTDRPKMRELFKTFLAQLWQEHEWAFLTELQAELKHCGKSAQGELGSLFSMLNATQIDTAPALSAHPVDTQDVDDTKMIQKQNKEKEEDLDAENSRFQEYATASREDCVELLRKNACSSRCTEKPGPRESTKRSALVMGSKQ